jgi:hypothetical protein
VGGLIYNEAPQARAELVRVVNELRKDKESLTDEESGRILSFAYPLSDPAELRQALSAVPADESWATYKWLDDPQNDDQQNTDTSDIEWQQLRRDYIHANILELSGRQAEALAQYKLLRSRLKGSNSTLSGPVQDAIKRLAANQGH